MEEDELERVQEAVMLVLLVSFCEEVDQVILEKHQMGALVLLC